MNSTPYHLHAVMVHQGQASGGHYWAYTRRQPSLSIPAPGSCSTQSHDTSEESSTSVSGEGCGQERGGEGLEETPEARTNYRTQLETGEMYTDCAQQSPESMVATDESASVPYADTGHPPASDSTGSGRGMGEGMEVERCGVVDERERNGWLKFNDVSVSAVSWEEVRKESLGGSRGNTSAYCLVYINRMLHEDWLSSGK